MLMRLTTTERENHRYGIGRSVIEDGRLLYGYDQLFDYTRDSRGARSSPQVATGLRPYGLQWEAGWLVCSGETHATRMIFTADRLHVYDGQRLLREWRRESRRGLRELVGLRRGDVRVVFGASAEPGALEVVGA